PELVSRGRAPPDRINRARGAPVRAASVADASDGEGPAMVPGASAPRGRPRPTHSDAGRGGAGERVCGHPPRLDSRRSMSVIGEVCTDTHRATARAGQGV